MRTKKDGVSAAICQLAHHQCFSIGEMWRCSRSKGRDTAGKTLHHNYFSLLGYCDDHLELHFVCRLLKLPGRRVTTLLKPLCDAYRTENQSTT